MIMTLEDIVEICRQRYRISLKTGSKDIQEEQKKLLQAMTFQLLDVRAKKIHEEFHSSFSLGFTKK